MEHFRYTPVGLRGNYQVPRDTTLTFDMLLAQVQTGLLSGGIIEKTGSTSFSIQKGTGFINRNQSVADPAHPEADCAEWETYPTIEAEFVATHRRTWVTMSFDDKGPKQHSYKPAESMLESQILLGVLIHPDDSIVNVVHFPRCSYGAMNTVHSVIAGIGPIKIEGHNLILHDDLTLGRTSGSQVALGRNYAIDPTSPNVIVEETQDPLPISYRFRDGQGDYTVLDPVSEIDPSKYDNGSGTLKNVSGGSSKKKTSNGDDDDDDNGNGSSKKWTAQRIFWFSRGPFLVAYYGQGKYKNPDFVGLVAENFVEAETTDSQALFLGTLWLHKDVNDLTDKDRAIFMRSSPARGYAI